MPLCLTRSQSHPPPPAHASESHLQLASESCIHRKSHVTSTWSAVLTFPNSCSSAFLGCSLPIMVPSIPEGGAKSRVETQVRVTVDLAHASSSSGEPFKYDRVGSWKWLKLPVGTATKKRTRKEGKIGMIFDFYNPQLLNNEFVTDPKPQDMLYLTSNISCASPPHNPVTSCASCQTREASLYHCLFRFRTNTKLKG